MRTSCVPAILAVALTVAACGEDDGPTTVEPTGNVRFFNATTGMTGSGGFTANGQFATGSTLAYGQSTCLTVSPGATAFGFGATNAGGTGLSGAALTTLDAQSITADGGFIVVAAGPATSPQMFLFDTSVPGTLGTNQTAVRFVNLAPGTEAEPNNFAVFIGTFAAGGTLAGNNIEVGEPTAFTTVASGNSAYSVLRNHELPPAVSGVPGTFDLPGGTVNTLAIVPNASGGFQLVNLRGC